MADGGKSPVTEGKSGRMTPQKLDNANASCQNLDSPNALQIPPAARPRPTILSQHSNSLPSTPYVHARKLSDEYRTPSPIVKEPAVVSSRSSRSESDSTTRTIFRGSLLGGCKYETGMAYSRRRIPYSIGGDMLDPVKNVKKTLDPAEEEKLSGDMRELYDRILPSADSEKRRTDFVVKLDKILNEKWPGNEIKVHVFGSSGNLLCSNDSDVDICITTPMKELERVCLLAKALAEHGMERVVCVPHAKVPIVKMWDPELELACDMNVNNTLALENTRMIRTYVEVDPRVRPLAMIIKHWTRRRILNDAALGGTLSSYTWICMIINFLQSRKPKILPTLQARPHACLRDAQGKISPFADDLKQLQGFGETNKETIGELLFHFFRRYGHEIDFEKHVISVREGALISKKAKGWHLMQNNRLCVEEPFNTDRNLGNTADDISIRGVHLELRRAFYLVSQAKLGECCDEYVFPPQEEKIWTRPTPQPRPILTRSLSQQGRKGGTMQPPPNRGNGNGNRNRTGPSGRRASSAAAMNKIPPFPANQPSGAGSAHDRLSGNQIHDQLYQHYQLLQVQEQQLRMQMQQRAAANFHAQVTAQLPPHVQQLQIPMSSYQQQGGQEGRRRQSNVESAPLSAPMRTIQNMYYPVQIGSSSNSSRPLQPHSTQLSSTNPPSPSISTSNPVLSGGRRGSERRVATDSFAMARSHSQPPRFSGSNLNMRIGSRPARGAPNTPFHDSIQSSLFQYTSLHQYQQAYLQGKLGPIHNPQFGQLSPAESPRMRPMVLDGSDDGRTPRQYVGYYVDPSAPQQGADRSGLVPQIPSFQDLARCSRRSSVSPNPSGPISNESRSPSPSHSNTSRDNSVGQFSSTSQASRVGPGRAATAYFSSRMGRSPANGVPSKAGPVIVDGSSEPSGYTTPPESFFSMGQSEAASLSDEQPCNTPSSASVATAQEQVESFALEPPLGYRMANSLPNILQFGDFPARATVRSERSAKSDVVKTSENPAPARSTTRVPIREQPNGLGIDFAGPSVPEAPAAGQPLPQTPSMPSPQMVPSSAKEPNPIPVALLSPVREVRTPSPAVTRNNSTVSQKTQRPTHRRSISLAGKDMVSSPLSGAFNQSKDKGREAHPLGVSRNSIATNGLEPKLAPSPFEAPTPAGDKALPSPSKQVNAPVSGWQQTISKRNKKSRKANSVGSAILNPREGERKGG